MGKKQGQAQRVQGNAQPSSSTKAAEMLQKIGSNYGFGSDLAPIGIGSLLEDSFDSTIDSDFRMSLKKLSKKDNLTRVKALEELKNLIETKPQESCSAIIPYWSKSYTKLSIDNDRKIREITQVNHEKLCSKINKSVAPHLKTIMPYWILSQSDSYIPAARIAESSFKNIFNETKQPEVIHFARDEILNVIHNFLIVETYKTLSDLKSVSEDEAQQKFENVICMSLRGLDLFIKYYLSSSSKLFKASTESATSQTNNLEKLEKIFTDNKFWKYSKDNSLKIRSEFFSLLNSLVDTVILNERMVELENQSPVYESLRKNLKAKLVPLVFYSCDEDNQSCSYFIFQSINKCLSNINKIDDNFWSLLNAKKAFIPKLIALIRHHANGNANNQNVDIVYPSLCPIIRELIRVFDDNNSECLAFLKDVLARINDGIGKDTNVSEISRNRFNLSSNRIIMIQALFDCLSLIIKISSEKKTQEFVDFCLQTNTDYVLKLFDSFLENENRGEDFGFEFRFQKYIEEDIESKLQPTEMRDQFWNNLSSILNKRLELSGDNEEQSLSVVKNFCFIFENSAQNENLLRLVEQVFRKYLKLFTESKNVEKSCIFLSCLNRLMSSFSNERLIDLFLEEYKLLSKPLSEVDFNEKVKLFNEKLIETILKNNLGTSSDGQKQVHLLYQIIELFIIANINLNKSLQGRLDKSLCAKLDYLIFDLNTIQSEKVQELTESYLANSKSKKLDSKIRLNITEWIIHSDKLFNEIISSNLFAKPFSKSNNNYESYEIIVQLVSNLDDSIRENDQEHNSLIDNRIKIIFNSIMEKISSYLYDFIQAFKSDGASMDELQNCFNCMSNLIISNKTRVIKFVSLDNIWSILLNCLKLNILNAENSNLIGLISKLVSLLVDNYLIDDQSYSPLVKYINDQLNSDTNDNNLINILFDLINYFKQNQTYKISHLYENLLFNVGQFSFEQIFSGLLFEKPDEYKVNTNLLVDLYLDKRLNYLYTQYHHELLNSSLSDQSMDSKTELKWLRQTNYVIEVLSRSLESSLMSGLLLKSIVFISKSESNKLNRSGWYYLILVSVLFQRMANNYLLDSDKHFLIMNIKEKFSKLLFGTDFMKLIFSQLLLDNEDSCIVKYVTNYLFGKRATDENKNKLSLNNLSFFFFSLCDLYTQNEAKLLIDGLNEFAQKLILALEKELEMSPIPGLNEVEIRFYLYDIPFARHSIIYNLNNLSEHVEYYYGLFSNLIESNIGQITQSMNQLKSSKASILDSLVNINFNMDILSKYIRTYLELFKYASTKASNNDDQSSIEHKLHKLFNSNEKTIIFIREKLSNYLLEICDLFIDLKKSIGSNYNFYFNFDTDCRESLNLEWQKFILLDKLNLFLQLFFIDFKFNNTYQQLSEFLNEKQWDFILCYIAYNSQCLNSKFNSFARMVSKTYIQIFSINYFDLADICIRTISFKCRDDLNGKYPKSIYSDWNGFFSKEIYDPLLCVYVNYTSYLNDQSDMKKNPIKFYLSYRPSVRHTIFKLCNILAGIPFERLIINQLEPKFNIMDLDLNAMDGQSKKKSLFNLGDSLKTVINHLVPNIKHQIGPIQLSSYKILRTIMKQINQYYQENTDDENDTQDNQQKIIDSLPYAIRECLTEFTDLFSEVKTKVQFDETLLIDSDYVDVVDDKLQLYEMQHNTNNKLMSYLLITRLILDILVVSDNLEFKVKLINNLREINFNDYLLNVLFRLMPIGSSLISVRLFQENSENLELDEYDSFKSFFHGNVGKFSLSNHNLQDFSSKLYKSALKCVPAMIRDWWNTQPKRIADQVDRFTTKYVSSVLLEEEIKQINRSAVVINQENENSVNDEDQSTIKIRGMLSTREIVSTYKMKELNMELIIHLPLNYPLGVVEVSSVRRLGVSENEWRNWLLQLTTYLTHQNGSIIQSLQIWKRNVDKKFSGVEECTICYNVIHGTNYQLPKMKCRTCRKLFHSICLYKWFESSSKSTCPLCRNLF